VSDMQQTYSDLMYGRAAGQLLGSDGGVYMPQQARPRGVTRERPPRASGLKTLLTGAGVGGAGVLAYLAYKRKGELRRLLQSLRPVKAGPVESEPASTLNLNIRNLASIRPEKAGPTYDARALPLLSGGNLFKYLALVGKGTGPEKFAPVKTELAFFKAPFSSPVKAEDYLPTYTASPTGETVQLDRLKQVSKAILGGEYWPGSQGEALSTVFGPGGAPNKPKAKRVANSLRKIMLRKLTE